MANSLVLQNHLLEHTDAFEGLLTLLPENSKEKSQEQHENEDHEVSNRKTKKLAKRKAKKQKAKEESGVSQIPNETKPVAETEETVVIYNDEGNAIGKFRESSNEASNEAQHNSSSETMKESTERALDIPTAQADNTQYDSTASNDTVDEKNDKPQENEADTMHRPEKSRLKHKPNPEKMLELRRKLASRIQEFKDKRKAPGTVTNGTVRTRDAMLAARREKERISKERAQLKRKRETDDEDDQEEEDEDDDDYEDIDDDSVDASNLMYSSVEFADGTKATADLKELRHQKSKKGPRDILGQLKHVEARQARIAKMNEEKRADIEEKNKWGRAIAQAEGSKVRDDVKKLKASLKRHKNKKLKSEKEWNERKDKVTRDRTDKVQKRNENIALKIERSKLHGKKAKKRAGFEGGIAKARIRRIKKASDSKIKPKTQSK